MGTVNCYLIKTDASGDTLWTRTYGGANEDIGYIPDRRSYAEGNYEPESARCAAGSGERLVEAAVKLLTDLHRQAGGDPK